MLTDFLQDQAALYASGGMSAEEREQFELILQFHQELRDHVAATSEAAAALAVAGAKPSRPSPGVKARLREIIQNHPQRTAHEAVVVSSPAGLVEWVSPAFTEMCGYSLEELRGKKLGPILQGPETDRATANRLREAVQAKRACRETILNYHKNGATYWVDINITAITNDAGEPLWLVAREREVRGGLAA